LVSDSDSIHGARVREKFPIREISGCRIPTIGTRLGARSRSAPSSANPGVGLPGFSEESTTAPSKPSPQTKFVRPVGPAWTPRAAARLEARGGGAGEGFSDRKIIFALYGDGVYRPNKLRTKIIQRSTITNA
jgi:hypothetical protein